MTQIEKLSCQHESYQEWLLFMALGRFLRQSCVAGDWGRIMETTSGVLVTRSEDDIGRTDGGPPSPPRYSRRLSDKILIAFHHACDQGDFEVAEQLLHVLEMMLSRRPLTPDGTRRRNMESLVAAHERLWHLRHPHRDEF
jgi:hypothetical protein